MFQTHGMHRTRFYKRWCGMKARCNNSNVKCYKIYGGRGISVCNRWQKFENFKEDMYASYVKHVESFGESNTTLDRINSNGDYFFENCRWATWDIQQKNKRVGIRISKKIRPQTFEEFCKACQSRKLALQNII